MWDKACLGRDRQTGHWETTRDSTGDSIGDRLAEVFRRDEFRASGLESLLVAVRWRPRNSVVPGKGSQGLATVENPAVCREQKPPACPTDAGVRPRAVLVWGSGKECLRYSQQKEEEVKHGCQEKGDIQSRKGPGRAAERWDMDWVCGDFSYGVTEALRVGQGTLGFRPKQWISGYG